MDYFFFDWSGDFWRLVLWRIGNIWNCDKNWKVWGSFCYDVDVDNICDYLYNCGDVFVFVSLFIWLCWGRNLKMCFGEWGGIVFV